MKINAKIKHTSWSLSQKIFRACSDCIFAFLCPQFRSAWKRRSPRTKPQRLLEDFVRSESLQSTRKPFLGLSGQGDSRPRRRELLLFCKKCKALSQGCIRRTGYRPWCRPLQSWGRICQGRFCRESWGWALCRERSPRRRRCSWPSTLSRWAISWARGSEGSGGSIPFSLQRRSSRTHTGKKDSRKRRWWCWVQTAGRLSSRTSHRISLHLGLTCRWHISRLKSRSCRGRKHRQTQLRPSRRGNWEELGTNLLRGWSLSWGRSCTSPKGRWRCCTSWPGRRCCRCRCRTGFGHSHEPAWRRSGGGWF